MVKIIRGKSGLIKNFDTSGFFTPQKLDHFYVACQINAPCLIKGEFNKWSDIRRYLAIACLFERDIEVVFVGPQEFNLDSVAFISYLKRFCNMYSLDINITYETYQDKRHSGAEEC